MAFAGKAMRAWTTSDVEAFFLSQNMDEDVRGLVLEACRELEADGATLVSDDMTVEDMVDAGVDEDAAAVIAEYVDTYKDSFPRRGGDDPSFDLAYRARSGATKTISVKGSYSVGALKDLIAEEEDYTGGQQAVRLVQGRKTLQDNSKLLRDVGLDHHNARPFVSVVFGTKGGAAQGGSTTSASLVVELREEATDASRFVRWTVDPEWSVGEFKQAFMKSEPSCARARVDVDGIEGVDEAVTLRCLGLTSGYASSTVARLRIVWATESPTEPATSTDAMDVVDSSQDDDDEDRGHRVEQANERGGSSGDAHDGDDDPDEEAKAEEDVLRQWTCHDLAAWASTLRSSKQREIGATLAARGVDGAELVEMTDDDWGKRVPKKLLRIGFRKALAKERVRLEELRRVDYSDVMSADMAPALYRPMMEALPEGRGRVRGLGPSGGNACFFHTAMQCMLNMPVLTPYLLQKFAVWRRGAERRSSRSSHSSRPFWHWSSWVPGRSSTDKGAGDDLDSEADADAPATVMKTEANAIASARTLPVYLHFLNEYYMSTQRTVSARSLRRCLGHVNDSLDRGEQHVSGIAVDTLLEQLDVDLQLLPRAAPGDEQGTRPDDAVVDSTHLTPVDRAQAVKQVLHATLLHNNSLVTRLLAGVQLAEHRCGDCGGLLRRYEAMTSLTLSVTADACAVRVLFVPSRRGDGQQRFVSVEVGVQDSVRLLKLKVRRLVGEPQRQEHVLWLMALDQGVRAASWKFSAVAEDDVVDTLKDRALVVCFWALPTCTPTVVAEMTRAGALHLSVLPLSRALDDYDLGDLLDKAHLVPDEGDEELLVVFYRGDRRHKHDATRLLKGCVVVAQWVPRAAFVERWAVPRCSRDARMALVYLRNVKELRHAELKRVPLPAMSDDDLVFAEECRSEALAYEEKVEDCRKRMRASLTQGLERLVGGEPTVRRTVITDLDSALKAWGEPRTKEPSTYSFTCPGCKHAWRTVEVRHEVVHWAPIVIIHLDRFLGDDDGQEDAHGASSSWSRRSYGYRGGWRDTQRKDNSLLRYPTTATLALAEGADAAHEARYDLFGVAVHAGRSVTSGHYVAHVKSLVDGQWYEANDATVSRMRDHAPHSGANLLCYYRRDLAPPPAPRKAPMPAPQSKPKEKAAKAVKEQPRPKRRRQQQRQPAKTGQSTVSKGHGRPARGAEHGHNRHSAARYRSTHADHHYPY